MWAYRRPCGRTYVQWVSGDGGWNLEHGTWTWVVEGKTSQLGSHALTAAGWPPCETVWALPLRQQSSARGAPRRTGRTSAKGEWGQGGETDDARSQQGCTRTVPSKAEALAGQAGTQIPNTISKEKATGSPSGRAVVTVIGAWGLFESGQQPPKNQ